MNVNDLVARVRGRSVAATIELGSVLVCILLFAGTFVLLFSGPPRESATPWLAIVGVGAAFSLFWTALVPLYERLA